MSHSFLRRLKIPGKKVFEYASLGLLVGYATGIQVFLEIADLKKRYALFRIQNHVLCHLYKALFGQSREPVCEPVQVEYGKVAINRILGWDTDFYVLTCASQSFPFCFTLGMDKNLNTAEKDKIIDKSLDLISRRVDVPKNELKEIFERNKDKATYSFKKI